MRALLPTLRFLPLALACAGGLVGCAAQERAGPGPGALAAPPESLNDTPPPPPPGEPRFVRVPFSDRTQWDMDDPPPCRLPDIVSCNAQRFTGGAAVRDLDGDGREEVYLSLYEQRDAILRYLPGAGEEGADEQGAWEEVAFEGLGEVPLSNGAAFADIDNDGDPDLVVGTVGGDRFSLFVNDGRGRFDERALSRGAAQLDETWIHTAMSLCFGDVDLDGYLDLHTTEWRGPNRRLSRSHNALLINRGARAPGFFDDRSEELGIDLLDVARGGAWGFSSQLSDLDGDRYPDLVATADYGSSRLFFNETATTGALSFLDTTEESAVGTEENGMGSALGDIDGDGDLDLFVGSIFDAECREGPDCPWGTTGDRLYRNEGDRRFTDITDLAGVRDGGWSWGARFFDYDLDGDLDLILLNGVRGTRPETGFDEENLRLFRNEGGRFTEVAESLGLWDTGMSRAAIPFDYDLDGDLDLLVTHNMAPPILFRNEASEGRAWLVVRPVGTLSNRDGMGAIVRVWAREGEAPMVRHAGNGCGFLGHSPGTPHFGLGEHERAARVEVEWPLTGRIQAFTDVPARQVLVVTEAE